MFEFQHDSELFGRVLRVNLAKPLRIKEGATKPVWADEEWLQMYSGKSTENNQTDPKKPEKTESKDSTENSTNSTPKIAPVSCSHYVLYRRFLSESSELKDGRLPV